MGVQHLANRFLLVHLDRPAAHLFFSAFVLASPAVLLPFGLFLCDVSFVVERVRLGFQRASSSGFKFESSKSGSSSSSVSSFGGPVR